MGLPVSIENHLRRAGVDYQTFEHASTSRIQQIKELAGLDLRWVVRAVLLRVGSEPVLAVLPAHKVIQFSRLAKHFNAPVTMITAEDRKAIFADCDDFLTPAVGKAYGLRTVVDADLDINDVAYLAVGKRDCLIKLSASALNALLEGVERVSFAVSNRDDALHGAVVGATSESARSSDTQDCLQRLYQLPTMPAVALRILELRDDPDATVEHLAVEVEKDPGLAAQVVRYACSPFFGFAGKVDSIRDAIHKVLGFELVANMAIGLAAGRSFQIPVAGPLGLDAFWRHATYTASLAQELARKMPMKQRPKLGTVYLAALLHNVGLLVLGHLFKPEFAMLNRLAAANPDTPLVELERQLLAMGEAKQLVCLGHCKLGSKLMHAWGMPDSIATVVAEHHREDYNEEHADLVALTLLADRLARRLNLGDGDSTHIPGAALARLGLSEDEVEAVYDRILEAQEGLDQFAAQMAA